MAVDPARAAEYLREKYNRTRRHRQELYDQACADFRRMVDHIRSRYRDVSVYQWGSLLQPERFDENSDIDIALRGVSSPEVFFRLQGELEKMTGFRLDLVELERIDPIDRISIMEKGRAVYEPT